MTRQATPRIDAEWVAVSAFRDLLRLGARGDYKKATYNNALNFGGELYPELLGPDTSLLRREREGDTAGEFRQKAKGLSAKRGVEVRALDLVQAEIHEYRDLVNLEVDKSKVDKLKRRLNQLIGAEKELNPVAHSENQLIFRDAYNADRGIPTLHTGKGHRDFQLPDGNNLRVRVLHPDKPEHVTGADIIYERHDLRQRAASIVAVQYKIWSEKTLSLQESRLQDQLGRLATFLCKRGLCQKGEAMSDYRFPYCAAFLRPTDRLQSPDQTFISTGEHLPICKIEECTAESRTRSPRLNYEDIREVSLSGEIFEILFNRGRIGSRMIGYEQLAQLYSDFSVDSEQDNVIIYAQDY